MGEPTTLRLDMGCVRRPHCLPKCIRGQRTDYRQARTPGGYPNRGARLPEASASAGMTAPESLGFDSSHASAVDIVAHRDEQLLVDYVTRGDPVALEAIFRRYHLELRATAERVLGSREAAEDVIQDVFLAIWISRTRWRVTTSVGAYLRRSVRNAALRRATRRSDRMIELATPCDASDAASDGPTPASAPLVAPDPSPLDLAERQAMAADVVRATATLPPRVREVFTLSRHAQLTNREIAERLTLSPKTVEMHLTRALAAMRSALAAWRRG